MNAALPKLEGSQLTVAALLLAGANFIVVLDMTIANVSVPHIAGGLAVSPNEGTYVITSYAVAEAISVPLTGWIAKRFGTLKAFVVCILLFGIFSALCGLATSIDMLVFGRVLQGLAGGPIMPLSQTLLLQIFPKDKQPVAIGLWAMTTLIAPILGPIAGGWMCDNWGWPFIFLINIPITIACSGVIAKILKRFETKIIAEKIDFVGMALLVLWVGALQIMLDEGKNHDWFESTFIVSLLIIAIIGFAAFLIWEFTHKAPIVDLKVFRHRGFSVSVLTISLAFGAFFGSVVLMPLWLQTYMGYSATWSGYAMAGMGVLAVVMAPIAAKMSEKIDPRLLVFFGVSWLGALTFYRSFGTTDMTFAMIAVPILIQGIGMPFFFVPLTGLAMASVEPEEVASASGQMNFLRTLSGAFATSLTTTAWDNEAAVFRSDLAGTINVPADMAAAATNVFNDTQEMALVALDFSFQSQMIMLATNKVFLVMSFMFIFAALAIWLAPKPTRTIDMSAMH